MFHQVMKVAGVMRCVACLFDIAQVVNAWCWKHMPLQGVNPRMWHTYVDEDSMKWLKGVLARLFDGDMLKLLA